MNNKLASATGIALILGMSVPAFALESSYNQFELGNVMDAKFNALLQGWSVQNQNTSRSDQNLRLRRAELKLSGSIAKAPKYFMMVDPAKLVPPPNGSPISADNMIQDMGLSYVVASGFEVTVGQFKIPTTAEGLLSAGDLSLPERSLIGRTLGDRRETGIRVSYKTNAWNATSMLSSGRSISGLGQGMINDLDNRIEITPVKNLGMGIFAVLGDGFDYSRKGRWGVNGRYSLGKFYIRDEYSQAKDGPVQSHGLVGEFGYWVSENLESIVRYETYSPNQAMQNSGKAETLGVNYYFRNYFSKLQLAASALQNMAASNGSPVMAPGTNNHEVTLAVQTAI